MSVGPTVFGENRRGLWVAENSNLTDKLKHYLPRLRNAIPNLTDLFLPFSAGPEHAKQVRDAGFFCHMWEVAHGRTPEAFAKSALANHKRIGAGALELNFEGSAISDTPTPDRLGLKVYIERTFKELRKTKPLLPVRANVVPWKGQFLPDLLFRSDKNAFVCAQTYGGNMDLLYAADEILENLTRNVGDPAKCNVMHPVLCSRGTGPRQLTLPQVRDKGAFYIDDLLLDAGLL